ncbi:MAG TPA: adenylosuccinate lyase [Firmicutes bacterium]|nr:adenylosuccinate lyase [Bacillota bacterium]HOQ24076.1 lyase family protein [Bacillota bacterium]HPT67520.1 lyase family protein [Bacillota bacterium]
MERSIFASLSPLDHRYYATFPELFAELAKYFSEDAMIRYELRVEAALTRGLSKRGICPVTAAEEVSRACAEITPEEVYAEEEKTKHNIRALVNCIQRRVSAAAKPFVHFTATSVDIMDTANALRFMEANRDLVLPMTACLLRILIKLAKENKDTVQVGRTHGQHAVPITFGFAMAQYVSRLGGRWEAMAKTGANLRGKLAGAVGAYNAASLFVDDPVAFEEEVLAELDIKPSPISTQIVQAEFLADYIHSVISAFGVLANLADDLRHLQRSEIAEVSEAFGEHQVGSSTMPHKRNPWNFENVKSMWKEFMPRMTTLYLDQISEHQRDLTNSASGRFVPEIVIGYLASVQRLINVLSRLRVDQEQLRRNLEISKEMVIAEPLYLLLANAGHPNAHEAVRRLTLLSQETGRTLRELLPEQQELQPYLERFTPEQRRVLEQPETYTGLAARKTVAICAEWEAKIGPGEAS